MVRINILTACIRSHNLKNILDSFIQSKQDHDVELHWYIIFDLNFLACEEEIEPKLGQIPELCDNAGISLHVLTCKEFESPVNVALEEIKTGYVTVIDDDNLMHPDYIEGVLPDLKAGCRGLLYHQDMGHVQRVVYRYRVKPNGIDTAQFTYSRELIGNSRWPDKQEFSPTPDGVFISRVYSLAPQEVKVLPRTLCYYNKLAN